MNKQNTNTSFSTRINQVIFFGLICVVAVSILFYFAPIKKFYKVSEVVQEIYFADNISPAHRIIIERFNNQNEGHIKVVPIDLSFEKFTTNERKELLARSLRSKNSKIDIFAVDQIWVPRFSRWAAPLESDFNDDQINGIREEILPTLYSNGKLMAVPLYMEVGVLYFRWDLLKDIPESEILFKTIKESISWEELLEIREKYFNNKEFYVFQGDNYEGLICNYIELLNENASHIYENGEFHINTPEGRVACNRLLELIQSGSAPPDVINFNENESYLYSIKNDVPFFRAWPSMVTNLDLIPQEYHYKLDQLEFAALPHEKGKSPAPVFGGWNLMISDDSEHKEASLKFLKYCLSIEAQEILFNEGRFLPVLKTLYSDESNIDEINILKYLNTLIPKGVHRPSHVKYSTISDILSNEINKILKGEISIKDGLQSAEKKISIINKN